MPHRHALFIAISLGTIAFALSFGYPAYHPLAVLWYYPLEHRWSYQVKAGDGLAIDFFGRCLLATVSGALAAAPSYFVARRFRTASPRILGLFTAWALTIVLLVMAFYAWQLHFRAPVPMPLPDWYEPR